MSASPVRSGTDWLRSQRAKSAGASQPTLPPCNIQDTQDSLVERWLQQHGVKYAPKTMIPLLMIDEKSSLGNQARDVPLVEDSVIRFTVSLRKGEYLPPIVVYPSGNKVVIVDGNNRHAAHKRFGSTAVPGFVIDENTPSETIALLTVAANNGHGVTPSVAWRLRQAAHLVQVGFAVERAVDAAGVTKSQLNDYLAVQRADAKAKQMKIQGFADLANTVRRDLCRLTLDSVFYQAARTTIDTAMTTDEVRTMVRDVKALTSESEQILHITKIADARKLEEKSRKATGRGGRMSSPYNSLLSSIGKIMVVDGAAVARQILTDFDRRELIRRLDGVGLKLIELQTALESRDEEVQRGA